MPKTDLPYGGDMQAAMKAQDRDAIRVIMNARPKVDSKIPSHSEPKNSEKNEEKEEVKLPYNGSLQKAMAARDRNAIKVLMAARNQKKIEAAAIENNNNNKSSENNAVQESKEITWLKFDEITSYLLEQVRRESAGTILQVLLTKEFNDVSIDVANMKMIDNLDNSEEKKGKKTRRLIRRSRGEILETEDAMKTVFSFTPRGAERCWVCCGSGRTSRWLENEFIDKYSIYSLSESDTLTKKRASFSEEKELSVPDCVVCWSQPGKYGVY